VSDPLERLESALADRYANEREIGHGCVSARILCEVEDCLTDAFAGLEQ
jgi:hypothetical protein